MVTTAEAMDCSECGAVYPVLARVPVMFDRVMLPAKRQYATAETAYDLLAAFSLPTDPIHVLQMRRLITQRPMFGDTMVQTEAAQFLDRVRSSGFHVSGRAEETCLSAHQGAADVAPRAGWLRDYIPRAIPPGYYFTANVRFRNIGTVPLRHVPPANITIAPRWLESDGRPVHDAEDMRTPLPLDMQPGQELTLPIQIVAPLRNGRYRLRLLMVEEGIAFLEDDAVEIPVSVGQISWTETPPGWIIEPDLKLDYGADHVRGVDILRRWIAELQVPQAKVLEIGGNANPAVADIDGQLHNVDVDLLGLQIGCLVQDRMEIERPGRRVRHLCADADDLPYADGYFDAIVMFAALHHFPDPARTLSHVATKLRPGGFIGLFCEPTGHVHPGAVEANYLRELHRGVNEQSFLLREWADIFRAAKLRTTEVRVQGGSLKARLMHAQDKTGAKSS